MERDYQCDLSLEDIGDREVVFTKGLGQAQLSYPDQNREFDHTAEVVLPALKSMRVINWGEGSKFDDRTYRLSNLIITPNRVEVQVGLTSFQAAQADIKRGRYQNKRLQEIGEEAYGDPWAFFSRPLGIAFLAITRDGSVFIGEREGELYHKWLNAAAGFADFEESPSFENFKKQAVQKLRQEYGRNIELIGEPRFAGIASSLLNGDADATWIGRGDVPDSYFESGKWLEERGVKEHGKNLVKIATLAERDQLLNEGRIGNREFPGIMYSTIRALEELTEEDFRPL